MKSITLHYREGSSDKVYQASIEPKGNQFVVNFAYGRRGTTLQTGSKTQAPVDLDEAQAVFTKLIKEITIAARSDGFLYRMVRSLAGFLIRVGMGDLPPAEAKKILEQKKRTAVVPTAPPPGLFLWRVYYE